MLEMNNWGKKKLGRDNAQPKIIFETKNMHTRERKTLFFLREKGNNVEKRNVKER